MTMPKEEKKLENLVSIVIPMYNTEKYIDRALRSLIDQSYKNIEIIIVNDASTDNSLNICLEWEKNDDRIKVYDKEHGGQGLARNYGVGQAKGKYLVFLDSDDWLELDAICKMVEEIEESQGDMVFFDTKCHEGHGDRIAKKQIILEGYTTISEKPELLYRMEGGVCDKIYNREFFLGCHVKQWPYCYEDSLAVPIITANARKITQIKEPLYHYERRRTESTTHIQGNEKYFFMVLEELKREFMERGIFYKNYLALTEYSRWLIKVAINYIKTVYGQDENVEILVEMKKFMDENYPDWNKVEGKNYLIVGSYNLRSIVQYSLVDIRKAKEHFQFSSIISIMEGSSIERTQAYINNSNSYRDNMLKKEKEGHLTQIWSERIKEINYICIDFLEERFDIINGKEKGYFTYSDALEESENDLIKEDTIIIKGFSEECIQLWKERCDMFIIWLKEHVNANQVILVKTYLAEKFGVYSGEQCFENIEEIRKINKVLEDYYNYFSSNYEGIHILEQRDSKYTFSDTYFKFGCESYHLNEAYYYDMSDKLKRLIEKD